MSDRERLIEILKTPIFPHEAVDPIEAVADYLIDSGVVVQKHGRWVLKEDLLMSTYYDCSACGEAFYLLEGTPDENFYNYCPNCGAKMDGEA